MNQTSFQFKKPLLLLSFSILLLSIFSDNAFARKRKITINADNDAKIYVDGKLVSSGTAKVIVGDNSTLNVRIEKTGFITAERNYINNGKNELPATDFVKLEVDDAYENSFTTDLANRDIDLKTEKNEEEAWKLINRIVASQFDVIEVTDKTTGYLRTAWIVKKFKSATIRTRLIIKSGNSSNLAFKVKLVSEIGSVNASSRDDESFKSWDRLLRSFENIIQELQSRLGK
ncbi:MAG: hypothetical protein IPL09_06450 [Bacteroidetes bacterium]|jgi:hypothetical protein|nr:hypothetical protein [Bacteroidota bacterium]MBK7039265.1 hypothetical protein [Bacteroidota bacterium]MBK7588145.1 hypothetical protein [Bacteroidota bacterium]MBK8329101.1 hypothetical protein [Bacteroidota bacterium]MBK9300983.1 hypothetical protein [Bacteroidota bacterium]